MLLDVSSGAQSRDDLAGLDALALAVEPSTGKLRRLWSATWPKLAAVALAVFLWQCVVWLRWKPEFLLPGPRRVWDELLSELRDGTLTDAVLLTMRRGLGNYAIAIVIGVLIGSLVASSTVLRSAVGSMITGLQTMPSVAWFPMALLLFKVSETAIAFVVVLGAAPSIANGLLLGIDNIPPLYKRAGRVLGARGIAMYRHVILPAAFPSFVGGLKQGWAFAWRSLLAGELIVIIPGHQSVGSLMQNARDFSDAPALYASMVVILVIGIVVDAVLFGTLQRAVRRRWGLDG